MQSCEMEDYRRQATGYGNGAGRAMPAQRLIAIDYPLSTIN